MKAEAPPEGGCLFIALENALSESFRVVHAVVHLDEKPVMDEDPRPAGGERAWLLPVAAGRVASGEHRVRVYLELAGQSASGVDLRRHRFEIQSEHHFEVEARGEITMRMVVYEKDRRGSAVVPMEERPTIQYVETSRPPPGP